MTIEALLKKTNLFLLDMDGTLYIDDIPIGAVRETLARLRGAEKGWFTVPTIRPRPPKNTAQSWSESDFGEKGILYIPRGSPPRNISKNITRENPFISRDGRR